MSVLECAICCVEKAASNFELVTSGCGASHGPSVCRNCVKRHIEEEFNGKGRAGASLICPSAGCASPFDLKDVQRFLPRDSPIIARYDQRLLQMAIERDPEFRWCPQTGCGNGQLVAEIDQSVFWACKACRTRVCVRHRSVFHDGATCQEYDESVDAASSAEAATRAALAGLGIKICPQCGTGLEKNEGCEHFTCRTALGCGAEFCWLCMADYEAIRRDGCHRHKPTCRLYAALAPGGH